MNNISQTRELLDLKIKIMMQRIDNLYSMCNILFDNSQKTIEVQSIKLIKEQYFQMYSKVIETEQYDKYREIEDIIIKQIAKVELAIDEYIYNSAQNCEEVIDKHIKNIYQSENYNEFCNLDSQIQYIVTLKKIAKLYRPYISKNRIDELELKIIKLKFDILYRRQIEQLIYKYRGENNFLLQYDNEKERIIFKELLEEKIKLIAPVFMTTYEYGNVKRDVYLVTYKSGFKDEQIKDDPLFKASPEQILSDIKLLERLIIIDMKKSPYKYINLLKAKIFNAHLCNIGNNPFDKKIYLTIDELHQLGFWNYEAEKVNCRDDDIDMFEEKVVRCKGGLKTNRVNYSLLKAILKSMITDEDISIVDCENLYKRFGFECEPILYTTGQQCVKMIFDDVKESEQGKQFLHKLKRDKKDQEKKYCKINFQGLKYEFILDEPKDLLNQLLEARKSKINIPEENTQTPRKRLFSKKQEPEPEPAPISKGYEEELEEKKEEIKWSGEITTDIDIIILLIKDIIKQKKVELGKFKLESLTKGANYYEIEEKEHTEIIEIEERNIEFLESLKNRTERLTLKEARELFLIINDIYILLNIKYNARKLLPLEYMGTQNSKQEYLAPIPQDFGWEDREVRHNFLYGSTYKRTYYESSDLEPLWKKYQKEFRDLGIDVKKYSRYYECEPKFEICVSLDDISELPIDYEKLNILTEEKMQEIIEREERNVR